MGKGRKFRIVAAKGQNRKSKQKQGDSNRGLQPAASGGGGDQVERESVAEYFDRIKKDESISSAKGMTRGQINAHAHTKGFIRKNLRKVFDILGSEMCSGRCHGEGGALGQIEDFERDIGYTGKIAMLKGDKKNNLDKPGKEGSIDGETGQPVTKVIATAWRLACRLDQRQKESVEHERDWSGMTGDERIAAEIQDEEKNALMGNRMMVYTQLADNVADGGGCEPGIIARLWPVLVNMAEGYIHAGRDQAPNRTIGGGAAEEVEEKEEAKEIELAIAASLNDIPSYSFWATPNHTIGGGAAEEVEEKEEAKLTGAQAELLTQQLDEQNPDDENDKAELAKALMMSMGL